MTSGMPTVTCSVAGTFSQQDVGKAMTVENGLTSTTDLNTVFVVAGLTSNPAQDTTTSQAVTFLFNAANTQTITPLGFIVEAIQ